MNWVAVSAAVSAISKANAETPRALVNLRHEIIHTTALSAEDKQELHEVMDRLQNANLYGQIALLGQLKMVLAKHAGFKAQFSEFALGKSG